MTWDSLAIMREVLTAWLSIGFLMGLLASATGWAAALPPGGTFTDDDGNVHEGAIEAIATAGITRGCNPPVNDRYCPMGDVTRGQMAAFLVRALGLPAGPSDRFVDVGASVFEDDIDRLAAAGITKGCNPPVNDRYCPEAHVTRGQMAAFLVRAYGYTDGGAGDRFVDDGASVFEDDIDRLAAAGITKGCNPPANDRYCPDARVRRDQMASFLARAEGLDLVVPPQNCDVFPADNIWNRRIDDAPVHAMSATWVATIGDDSHLHADFGSGVWPPDSTSPIGIPYVEVDGEQPLVDVTFTAYGDESDPGPYPIPAGAPIEGGPDATGDRHVIVVDTDACILYEVFSAFPGAAGSWEAANGAVFDLTSNSLRPDGWTSGDAAGLPIYPGLVRYDEVASGVIDHAIRFTAPETRNEHVWPARHDASTLSAGQYPPMGQRFRLKSDFDISGFDPDVQVILQAFKDYGIILADNGSPWFVSGAPDDRWDNDVLQELHDVFGSAFEAVDLSGMIVDPDSGQAGG